MAVLGSHLFLRARPAGSPVSHHSCSALDGVKSLLRPSCRPLCMQKSVMILENSLWLSPPKVVAFMRCAMRDTMQVVGIVSVE